MEEKVIIAKFGKTKVAQTEKQWRYNHGQKLKFEGVDLPANYEVHFSNSKTGTAKSVIGNADGALIPQEYFVPGSMIYAWVYVEDDGVGVTKREVRIPIDQKARPTDQQPLPEEQTIVEQAIEALNDAVEDVPNQIDAALAEAKASGEFNGNNIWISQVEPINIPIGSTHFVAQISDLVGREDVSPAIDDLVYAPALDSDNTNPTYLYRITSVSEYDVGLSEIGSLKGDSGFSPYISSSPIHNGHRVTVTNEDGADTFDVMDGVVGNMEADLQMNGFKIKNLAEGVDDTDGVNKAQVLRMIGDGSGTFRGSFPTKAMLNILPWQSTDPSASYYVDNNDYSVVLSDETQHYECWRYSYTVRTGWLSQYRINEAPMTAAQIDAINSGITANRLVALEQFKAAGELKLDGIESGAQVNDIEIIRVWDDATHQWVELSVTDKAVNIPASSSFPSGGLPGQIIYKFGRQDGSVIWRDPPPTIVDFVYDETSEQFTTSPDLNDVLAAAPAVIAKLSFSGGGDTFYLPLVNDAGEFFAVFDEGYTFLLGYNSVSDSWIFTEGEIGGGGGTSDYTDLANKPQINSVTLSGDKSLSDLGIEPEAFVVTVTESNGTYSADKTATQIIAAANANKRVIAMVGVTCYQLFVASGGEAYFTAIYNDTSRLLKVGPGSTATVSLLTIGTYSLPSGGIPATDLASAVQTSLGKADSAYQKPSGGIPGTDLASGVIPTVPSASSATPQALGTAAAGSSTDYSRADHVHAKPSASDIGAVASDQGSGNAGKFLVVGNDGYVTTMTLSTWSAGSY